MTFFWLLTILLTNTSAAFLHDVPTHLLIRRDALGESKSQVSSVSATISSSVMKSKLPPTLDSSVYQVTTRPYSKRSIENNRIESGSESSPHVSAMEQNDKKISQRGKLQLQPHLIRRGTCLGKICNKEPPNNGPRQVHSRTSSQSALQGSPGSPPSRNPSTGSPVDKFRVESPSTRTSDSERLIPPEVTTGSRRPSSASTIYPGGPRARRPASADSFLSGEQSRSSRPSFPGSNVPMEHSSGAALETADSIGPGGRRSSVRPASAEPVMVSGRLPPGTLTTAESILPRGRQSTSRLDSPQSTSQTGLQSSSPPAERAASITSNMVSNSEIVTPRLSSASGSDRIESFYPHRGGERRVKMTGSPGSSNAGSPRAAF